MKLETPAQAGVFICTGMFVMKSVVKIDVEMPRQRLARLFVDLSAMPQWIEEIARVDHLGGEPGKPGAKYQLVPKPGSTHQSFVATVTRIDLPQDAVLRLESPTVDVVVHGSFIELSAQKTRFVSEEEFLFPGFFNRIFGWFATTSRRCIAGTSSASSISPKVARDRAALSRRVCKR